MATFPGNWFISDELDDVTFSSSLLQPNCIKAGQK